MTDLHTLLAQLWPSVNRGRGKALPRLPRDPLAALMRFFESIHNETLQVAQAAADRATYARLALLGDARSALAVLAPVAEMVQVVTPWHQDTSFYVDTVADREGHHRVYARDEEAGTGLPWGGFASLEAFAGWMCDRAAEKDGWGIPKLADEWEAGPSSGSFVLEELLSQDIGDLWSRAARRSWPGGSKTEPRPAIPPGEDRTAGWQRRYCLAALQTLRCTRALDLAAIDELDPVHRAFIDHLDLLAAASTGEVPAEFERIAADADHPLCDAAMTWIEQIEGKAASGASSGASLAAALGPPLAAALEALVAAEQIEVAAVSRAPLIDELIAAAAEAKSAEDLLKALVATLLASDHVEEVFASDNTLHAAFRQALTPG